MKTLDYSYLLSSTVLVLIGISIFVGAVDITTTKGMFGYVILPIAAGVLGWVSTAIKLAKKGD